MIFKLFDDKRMGIMYAIIVIKKGGKQIIAVSSELTVICITSGTAETQANVIFNQRGVFLRQCTAIPSKNFV